MNRNKWSVWTVMYQRLDGKLSICNYADMNDAIKRVDSLKDDVVRQLQKDFDMALVVGNHREFVIIGYKEDKQVKAIIKIVPSNLCLPAGM
jgi:hypothetical protein